MLFFVHLLFKYPSRDQLPRQRFCFSGSVSICVCVYVCVFVRVQNVSVHAWLSVLVEILLTLYWKRSIPIKKFPCALWRNGKRKKTLVNECLGESHSWVSNLKVVVLPSVSDCKQSTSSSTVLLHCFPCWPVSLRNTYIIFYKLIMCMIYRLWLYPRISINIHRAVVSDAFVINHLQNQLRFSNPVA
jgi:hypothetical protein